jgi:hypothetical protein
MSSRFLPNNVHVVERFLRIVLGAGLVALAFVGPKTPWGYLGAILVVTGLVGSCPIFTLLGVSTCKVPATPKKI